MRMVRTSKRRSYGRENEEKEKYIESYDGWMCVCRDKAEHSEK
jgi:hypothetical protein